MDEDVSSEPKGLYNSSEDG